VLFVLLNFRETVARDRELQLEVPFMFHTIKRLAIEDSGMEMLEWAIVAVVFAAAAATAFGTFSTTLSGKITGLSSAFGTTGTGTGTN
jgi:Flp pilus assembly pilin Flp